MSRTLLHISWLARSAPASSSRATPRYLHDYVRGSIPNGTYKVALSSPKVVGVCQSRGSRFYQEDAVSVHALSLDPEELGGGVDQWDPSKAGSDQLASQVAYFGIFDGHGGADVSSYLRDHLAAVIETASVADVDSTVQATIAHGGYFRRWRGGELARLARTGASKIRAGEGESLSMTLRERLTLAFLSADRTIRTAIGNSGMCGSTASVVLLHSLDEPGQPHWASQRLHLTVAHCGVILCKTVNGQAVAVTERHHAEARVEAARLRRMGADRLIADSFGETRWMGAVENTRGFGDFEYKPSGVTAEPEVMETVLDGAEHAYIMLVTDGLTTLLSDQELVDLARSSPDPTRAAKAIVDFAEDLGAPDNCSCIIVPLAGWGKVGGQDTTKDRREYRHQQAAAIARSQRM